MPKLSEINQKPPEYMEGINNFVSHPRGYLVIAGTNGNGKTFTAKSIFDFFWEPHCDNIFWNQSNLNLKWLDDINKYGSASYLIEQLIKAPLLVLDDIGTRKPSEAFMDVLYIVSDRRYELMASRGTIITTNLSSQAMREQFGDAFVSRISSGICIRHEGPDRRANKF